MSDLLTVALMTLVAVASGMVGVFALMRRMILASDAISHVALPGLGAALLFRIDPFLGGLAALVVGAVLIWMLERKTQISTDVIIGVFFSASLAVGSLLTPQEDLLEALFGQNQEVGSGWLTVGILASLAIVALILFFKNHLTLALISPDLAVVSKIPVSRINLYFLLIFVLDIILGLQFLGVLLMGSLIIVPAAVAQNVAWSLSAALAVSVGTAVVSVLGGYLASVVYSLSLGPTVISIAAGLFFLSLFWRRS